MHRSTMSLAELFRVQSLPNTMMFNGFNRNSVFQAPKIRSLECFSELAHVGFSITVVVYL